MDRRSFLASALAAAPAGAAPRPLILLRNSWQVVNIGDIAHTPGILALLEKYVPGAGVHLWPSSVAGGVAQVLRERFPGLEILEGADAIRHAFAECGFFLHGSGASLVAQRDLARWKSETGKPYGVYGITHASSDPQATELLTGARFAWFRDSVSLETARANGVRCPAMGFAPDAAFACDLRDDARAEAFLREHGLEEGRFLCCIPRYRYTPVWKMPSRPRPFDERKNARDEEMKEHDHAPLREAIAAVVRETSLKVLICPEDETQVEIGREMLYNRLPDAVRARVVWRDRFWLTGEAVSTYVRSAGLFGNEMHSPILCIGHGIPAIVCRWAEQTSKGIMWRDIGLGDWLFDLDREEESRRVVPAVLAMARDPEAARRKAGEARRRVEELQRRTMDAVAREVAGAQADGQE